MATLEELESRLDGWDSWREEAVRRFTAVEEAMAAGQEQLAEIRERVSPVLKMLTDLSGQDSRMSQALSDVAGAVAALAEDLERLDTRVQGIARVARPGRTVIRGEVETLKAQVAALTAAGQEGETRETDEPT
jgi:chromosome segregation ATPase